MTAETQRGKNGQRTTPGEVDLRLAEVVAALSLATDLGTGQPLERALRTGTNNGPFMGMPPTGRAIHVRGLELFRIAGGKIVELWRHDDDAGLLRQLGLIPTGAAANA